MTGKEQEAPDSIDHAIILSEALNQEHPNDSQVLYELGLDYGESSGIAHPDDPGEKSRPLDDVRKALTASEAALRVKPDDPRILHLYATNLGGIGQYLVDTDPRAALPYYQRELEIERKLTQRSSAIRYASGVAHAYGQITNAYEYIGDNTREFENAAKALAIYQDLSHQDSKNASLGQHAACSEKMGEASALAGDPAKAADYFHQALAVAEPLISPKNEAPDYFHAEPIALYAAADAYSGLGDLSFRKAQRPGQTPAQQKVIWTEARSWYAKSLETWRRIGHPNHRWGQQLRRG